jgi:lysophospholipase L1-like esterase
MQGVSKALEQEIVEKPRVPRWKRLLQNLALAGATFLLCGIVLELILRLSGYGNLEIYEPDPALYWKLKPNQNCFTKIDRKPVRINSHGTRGPEFSVEKPPDTIRILSLGDSRTFGWGLADDETYSRRLETMLNEFMASEAPPAGTKRVEVINAGVNAWSYSQMLVYFRDTALKYNPDIVLLGEANLWTQFSEKNSPEFVKQFLSRVRLKNLLRRFALYHYVVEVKLKDFYEQHRTRFIPVNPEEDTLFQAQQQADPDAVFRDAIEGICVLARSNGVKPVLLYLPALHEMGATNAPRVLTVKAAVRDKANVRLVDLTDDLRPEGNALYLEADPVHFNARGNEMIARRVFETVTNIAAP